MKPLAEKLTAADLLRDIGFEARIYRWMQN